MEQYIIDNIIDNWWFIISAAVIIVYIMYKTGILLDGLED